jgi:hypothetical protein
MGSYIGYKNLMREDNVLLTASSEATGFPVENLTDFHTFDSWKPNTTGSAYIDLYTYKRDLPDYIGIYAKDLASAVGSIKGEYYSAGSAAYITHIAEYIPESDGFMKLEDNAISLTPASDAYLKYRITFNPIHNYLYNSSGFNLTGWTQYGSITITADQDYDGDRVLNADKLLAGTTDSQVYQEITIGTGALYPFTAAVQVVKGSTSGDVKLQLYIYNGGTPVQYEIALDWDTLTVSDVGPDAPTDYGINTIDADHGIYQIWLTGYNNLTSNVTARISVYPDITNGTGSIYASKAQLLGSAVLMPYSATTSSLDYGQVGEISIVNIGKALELPNGMQSGFVVPNHGYDDDIMNVVSETGLYLGRSLKSKGRKFTISQPPLCTASFVRNSWIPFLEHARLYPFFFTWDNTNYPGESVFCQSNGPVDVPSYDTYFMKVNLDCIGLS